VTNIYPDVDPANILVVEDDLTCITILTHILQKSSYKVKVALNGETALEVLKDYKADLILLDIGLPNINGYEVCRRIKSNPDTSEIPVLFISGANGPEFKIKAFHSGGVDFITKVFEPLEVVARVNSHLETYQSRKKILDHTAKLNKEIEGLTRDHSTFDNSRDGIIIFNKKQKILDGIFF